MFDEDNGYRSLLIRLDRIQTNSKSQNQLKSILHHSRCMDREDRIDLKNAFNLNLCPLEYLSQGEDVMIDENEKMYILYCGTMYFCCQ